MIGKTIAKTIARMIAGMTATTTAKTTAKFIVKTIAKRNLSDGLEISRLLPWVVRAFSALLLLSGAAYATPITDLGNNDLRNVLPWVRPVQAQLPTGASLSLAAGNIGPTPYIGTSFTPSSQASSDECVWSSDCSPTFKVPEPQSLVLVGSGFLSMAGLIRRRLLH
jgi:hypothetical protein